MFKKIAIAAAVAFISTASLAGAGTGAEASGYKDHSYRHGHVVVFKKSYFGHGYGYDQKFYGYQHKPAFWWGYGHNRRWR